MTRGEALLAMEGGARVRTGSVYSLTYEFWLENGCLESTYDGSITVWDWFSGPTEYELVPEPDTAEKFVRDMAELLKRDPKEKSLFWLCEKATPDTHDYTWRQRFDALLAQMDGEK